MVDESAGTRRLFHPEHTTGFVSCGDVYVGGTTDLHSQREY
jgi:hypothetical protein